MGSKRKRLGETLIEAGVLYPFQLQRALEVQAEMAAKEVNPQKQRLGKVLIRLGFLTENQMVSALASQLNLRIVKPSEQEIPRSVLEKIPREKAEEEILIPYAIEGNKLAVAMSNPLAWTAIYDIQFRAGMEVVLRFRDAISSTRALSACLAPRSSACTSSRPATIRSCSAAVAPRSVSQRTRFSRKADSSSGRP